MPTKQDYHIQSVTINYTDDIQFVQRLLNIYIAMGGRFHLTPMYTELLTYCIIEDMNKKGFKESIIGYSERFKSQRHIDTKLSDLRRDGLIEKHDKSPRWRLAPEFEAFKNMLGKKKAVLSLIFEK